MSDRFEEAVRQAAQGLADAPDGETPSYHGAWQRGRRRRMFKQAGVACAGALVVVAALTVNLGDFGRGNGVDTAEVATDAAAATAVPATAVPTTPALSTEAVAPTAAPAIPTQTAAQSTQSRPADEPEPDPTSPPATAAPSPSPVAAATATPVPPTAVAQPTVVPPTATAVPTVAENPVEQPTATPGPSIAATAPEPSPTVDGAAASDSAQTTELSPDRTIPEPATATGPAALPNITFIGPNQKADAIVLDVKAVGPELPCDIDRDGTAEATCRLFERYACTGDGDVRAGFLAVDLNEDGSFDTCVGQATTACDTSGDDLADTPCTITFKPIESEESG